MISVNIFNNSNSNSSFLIYLFIFLAQVKSEKGKRPLRTQQLEKSIRAKRTERILQETDFLSFHFELRS